MISVWRWDSHCTCLTAEWRSCPACGRWWSCDRSWSRSCSAGSLWGCTGPQTDARWRPRGTDGAEGRTGSCLWPAWSSSCCGAAWRPWRFAYNIWSFALKEETREFSFKTLFRGRSRGQGQGALAPAKIWMALIDKKHLPTILTTNMTIY